MRHRVLVEKVRWVKKEIEWVVWSCEEGKIVGEGLWSVIIGRGNVGKCWLLNRVVEERKVIVRDIAGSRREVIEEYVNV